MLKAALTLYLAGASASSLALAVFARPNKETVAALDPAAKICSEAEQLLKRGELKPAEVLLRQAVTDYPGSSGARTGLASALLAEDKPFAALAQVGKLIEVVPPDTMPLTSWLVCAKVYHRTNHLSQCLHCYEAFLKAAPASDEKTQYEALAAVIKDQVKQAAAKPNAYLVTVSGAPDYFKEAVSDGFFRWPTKRLPLKMLIHTGERLASYKPEYEEAVRQAVDDWNKASAERPQVIIIEGGDADITVDFVDDLHAPALKAEAGKAQLTANMDGVDKASVLLLTLSPFPGQQMNRDFMRMIAVHEIGHSLGLVGHSPYEDDVMFPSLSAQRGITTRDINTLHKLYDAAVASAGVRPDNSGTAGGASAGTAGNAGVESDSLLDALPLKGKVQLLFSQAAQARAEKDSAKALRLFIQLLKLDPSNKNGLTFMANELNDIGLAKWEDGNLALKYFRWATYLQPSEEIYQKNISASLFNLQLDPNSQSVRLAQAEKCLASKDYRSAVVEFRAAQKIKADPIVATKIVAAEQKARMQNYD